MTEKQIMKSNILLVSSEQEANTYFLFREISKEQYKEIKIKIEGTLIKCSEKLKPEETNYIKENISHCGFLVKESILNYNDFF